MTTPQPLAGRGRRLAATVIDIVLVPLGAILLMLVSGTLEHAEDWSGNTPFVRIVLLGLASYLALNGWLLWRHGQTVGKKLTGIAIFANQTDAPLGGWRLAIRALFFPTIYLAALGPLAILPIADQALIFRKDRKCVHDWVTGTRVVRV